MWMRGTIALVLLASCASGKQGAADAAPPADAAAEVDAAPPMPDAGPDLSICTTQPCFPGVSCTVNPASEMGYDCGPCPAGYSGDGITCTDADACEDEPCFEGVACIDLPAPDTGFECGDCPSGFAGDGITCVDADACDDDPCFPGVVCTDLPPPQMGFECGDCPPGYEGSGFTCTDIDACAGDPCFANVDCFDLPPPSTGFDCDDCPIGYFGDGESCDLWCDPATSISCGSSIASSNTGIGSADQVDQWECVASSLTGPEILYAFTAPVNGLVAASLTGLSADLDLIVIEDAGGICDPLDTSLCSGSSTRAGTADEFVSWQAISGVTYYIIVDGWNGATSTFTLQIGTPTSALRISEIGLGSQDFVEIGNDGVCDVDLGGFAILHHPSLDPSPFEFIFPGGSVVDGGGVFRMLESGAAPFAANEVSAGMSILDIPSDVGFTAFCVGSCDTSGCTNMLDYVERDDDMADDDDPAGPACASFSPGPVDASGAASFTGLIRNGDTGAPTSWVRNDWDFGSSTRD